MTITFDARYLARGWLAAATFSSKDEKLPVLNKTILVEEYTDGVRLVATDRYVLLTSWVPALGKEDNPEPGDGDAPEAAIVVRDPDARGAGLLTYLLKLAGDLEQGDDPIEVRLRTRGVVGPTLSERSPTFSGMETEWVQLDFPGCEKVTLEALDSEYPHWRRLLDGFREKRTAVIGLNPEILGRLSKMGKLFPESTLIWRFGGAEKMALVELLGSWPAVRGAVMPVRYRTEAEIRREEEIEAAKAKAAAERDAEVSA